MRTARRDFEDFDAQILRREIAAEHGLNRGLRQLKRRHVSDR
jgi:hypothetical protein